ncbi:hypothetical protein NQ314_011762 [Rhamnusium bicolor]|uniref:Uncharacterized protein n=1 Tax=Rhamnusium bicolor TaxID=1586634 RepID=A0AAV8XG18_9CUCU|nr:hypothetical protein NQ314_011762 [Rhamnusium bicolor]
MTWWHLHNWLIATSSIQYLPPGSVVTENNTTCQIVPGSWRNNGRNTEGMGDITSGIGSNNYSNEAGKLRDSYADYFMDSGSVPWQLKMISVE